MTAPPGWISARGAVLGGVVTLEMPPPMFDTDFGVVVIDDLFCVVALVDLTLGAVDLTVEAVEFTVVDGDATLEVAVLFVAGLLPGAVSDVDGVAFALCVVDAFFPAPPQAEMTMPATTNATTSQGRLGGVLRSN